MINLLQKLVAIVESLIAVVVPLASPSPEPVVLPSNSPVVESLAVSPTPTPLLTPMPTPSPVLTPTPSPDIQTLIKQLEELRAEIVAYTPEPTPQPTPVSTPTPTPTPEPTPKPLPTTYTELFADYKELKSRIDWCFKKFPQSTKIRTNLATWDLAAVNKEQNSYPYSHVDYTDVCMNAWSTEWWHKHYGQKDELDLLVKGYIESL